MSREKYSDEDLKKIEELKAMVNEELDERLKNVPHIKNQLDGEATKIYRDIQKKYKPQFDAIIEKYES